MRGTDIQEIFAQLGVDEATHAFYLGQGADEGEARDHAGQDLPAGGRAAVGLSHAARRRAAPSTCKLTQRRRRRDARAPEPG